MNSKNIFLSLTVGVCGGITSAVFIHILKFVTEVRLGHTWLIWFLPVAGLITGLMYHLYGSEATRGSNLIFEEIHSPRKIVPLLMAPLVLTGTILSQFFGASAGREGAAVQISASIADNISRFFKSCDRTLILMAGVSAGFGSAIGAPIAGMLFGMEVITIGKMKMSAWPYCLLASFAGYYTSLFLKIPHTHFVHIMNPEYNFRTLGSVLAAGLIFGLAARVFSSVTHFAEHTFKKIISVKWLIPALAGVLIVALYYVAGTFRYAGLGLDVVNESLHNTLGFRDPLYKSLFTILSVGSGFKGGEFVPIVFIGSTLGSALSAYLPAAVGLLAAIGFAAVFAGAANTPLTCSIMAAEIFGWHILPYALIGCYLSYFMTGHHGIYNQTLHKPKLVQDALDRNVLLRRFPKR